jgi:hypothetical protein
MDVSRAWVAWGYRLLTAELKQWRRMIERRAELDRLRAAVDSLRLIVTPEGVRMRRQFAGASRSFSRCGGPSREASAGPSRIVS